MLAILAGVAAEILQIRVLLSHLGRFRNLGLMGVKLPKPLKNMLEAMRDKASSGEEKKV